MITATATTASIILAENANGCGEAVSVNDRSASGSVGGGNDGVDGDDGGSSNSLDSDNGSVGQLPSSTPKSSLESSIQSVTVNNGA